MPTAPITTDTVIDLMEKVRQQHPLVQCLTNAVTTNFVANALLAAGATPAMCDGAGEAELFARNVASGILVNVGTPHPAQIDGIREIDFASADTPPWVLDPVAVGALPVRTQLCAELLAERPTIIRGNASEIVALAGAGDGGRGVDSLHGADEAADAAADLARRTGGAVAVSGAVDLITDGTTTVRVANGDPMFGLITGGGCALGGVTAAYAAVADTPLQAAAAATAVYDIAGEIAAAQAAGPGSFQVAFLDALHNLTADDITGKARLS